MANEGKVFSSDLYKKEIERLKGTGLSDFAARNKAQSSMDKYYTSPSTYTSPVSSQGQRVQEQTTQANKMASLPTQEARQGYTNELLQGRKATTLSHLQTNPNVSPEYLSMYENYWNPESGKIEGASPEEWAKVKQAEWAKLPEEKRRNFDKEKETAESLGVGTPTKEDEGNMYEMVYGDNLPDMIASGQILADVFSAEKLVELGLTPERLQHLVDSGDLRPEMLAEMEKIRAQGKQAAGVLGATPKPSNASLEVLTQALNAKNNFRNQPLGKSALFEMAGLSGYEVLAQSLSQRSNEMKQRSISASNLVSSVGGAMAAEYKAIADNYDRIRDDYDKQMERLISIDTNARNNEAYMDRLEVQHQNNIELAKLQEEFVRERDVIKREADSVITNPQDRLDYAKALYEYYEMTGGQPEYLPEGETYANGKYTVTRVGNGEIYVDLPLNTTLVRGECGEMVNDYMGKKIIPDSYEGKKALITTQIPSAGSVFISDAPGAAAKYGHTGIVEKVNDDGTVNIVESNYSIKHGVSRRTNVPITEFDGFFTPPDAKKTAPRTGKLSTEQQMSLNRVYDNAKTDKDISEFPSVRDAYLQAKNALEQDSGVGDIVLMRTIAKITDPSTGVREEEFKTFESAQSTLSRYGVALTKKWWAGDRLTDEGRAAMFQIAQSRYEEKEKNYTNAYKAYDDIAIMSGLPSGIFMPYKGDSLEYVNESRASGDGGEVASQPAEDEYLDGLDFDDLAIDDFLSNLTYN